MMMLQHCRGPKPRLQPIIVEPKNAPIVCILCIYDFFQIGLTSALFTCQLIKKYVYIVHEET